jgi:hypothetical protein
LHPDHTPSPLGYTRGYGGAEIHGVKHLLEQGQSTLGGDLFAGEFEIGILELWHAKSLCTL